MASTAPTTESALLAAVGDFLHPASPQTCLLIVHPDIPVLQSTSQALLATHGWSHLSLGRELSAALLQVSPPQRPRFVPRWLTDRLAPSAPGPVLCTGIDHLRRSPRFDVHRQGGGLDTVRPTVAFAS